MIIVLDGYDGSGKTTIANQLIQEIGGTYVKSYTDALGRLIWALLEDREYDLASLVAQSACRKEEERNESAENLVFDRHWMTLFSLLPEEHWERWFPLPQTFLIAADTDTVIGRLHERREKIDTPRSVHIEQQTNFRKVAERFGIQIIDTTSATAQESVQKIRKRLGVD